MSQEIEISRGFSATAADIFAVLVAELNKDQVYSFAKNLLRTLGLVTDDPEPFRYE